MSDQTKQRPSWNELERFLLTRQIETGDPRYQDAATLLYQQRKAKSAPADSLSDDFAWAHERVQRLCASDHANAMFFGNKLISGFPYHTETFRAAQNARAMSIVLAELDRLRAAEAEQRHRCSGCGHRWEGPLKGAELCGDCWRTKQHAEATVQALRAALTKADVVLSGIWAAHRDKESPDYNACEQRGECGWCEIVSEVRAMLAATPADQER